MASIRHAVLRLPGVSEAAGRRTTALYGDIKRGVFPPPVKLGRTSCWPAYEVDAVLAARIAGKTDNEIRELVRELVAERARAPRQVPRMGRTP